MNDQILKDAPDFARYLRHAKLTAPIGVGTSMADGSIFAGYTGDGAREIYVMPANLAVTMTFNDAARAVEQLRADRALGHNDWQIPTLDQLKVLSKNINQGILKGTFAARAGRGSDFPDWYWASTEDDANGDYVPVVRLNDGDESWNRKDGNRLSCRPVRLVAAV